VLKDSLNHKGSGGGEEFGVGVTGAGQRLKVTRKSKGELQKKFFWLAPTLAPLHLSPPTVLKTCILQQLLLLNLRFIYP
jgi:hypothetical protein